MRLGEAQGAFFIFNHGGEKVKVPIPSSNILP